MTERPNVLFICADQRAPAVPRASVPSWRPPHADRTLTNMQLTKEGVVSRSQ
jgi:hypothetical protein